MTTFGEMELSPDGRHFFVVTHRGVFTSNELESTIAVLDAQTSRVKALVRMVIRDQQPGRAHPQLGYLCFDEAAIEAGGVFEHPQRRACSPEAAGAFSLAADERGLVCVLAS